MNKKIIFGFIILIIALLLLMAYESGIFSKDKYNNIDIGINPGKGNLNASIVIVEFSDFQCPACKRALPIIDEILEDYNGEVVLYFKNFPLDFHENAFMAALAAEAANEQGKFWEYHDVLYDNQDALDRQSLIKYAQELGLNMTQFNDSFNSQKYRQDIIADIEYAKSLNVRATPTFFINGYKIEGAIREKIIERINEELDKNG